MHCVHAIILAAGKGSRMHSLKPKVLHKIAHKTLLEHVFTTAKSLVSQVHIVIGFASEQVQHSLNDTAINWVQQAAQLGTGDAVKCAAPFVAENATVLILYGDVPLISQPILVRLIDKAAQTGFAVLSVNLENPAGYGRIVRDCSQNICAIVEHKDASSEILKIREVNTGMMAISRSLLDKYLQDLRADNAQGEYYLTDLVALAVADNQAIASVISGDIFEVAGVNDKIQLARLERAYQAKQAEDFMARGLTLRDPKRFDCRGNLRFGLDCTIDVNVVFEGDISLGDGVTIAPNCSIKNSKIGKNVAILENCVIENAHIKSGASIGPFARIRPHTEIGENAKIGNFVEVKKSRIGANSKISHLSYIGDTVMGRAVNIGAGVITCNYDGTHKHQTTIGDGAFVGSDVQLIAPVSIGKNATIGAGSSITKDAPEGQLTLSRSRQTTFKNWRSKK